MPEEPDEADAEDGAWAAHVADDVHQVRRATMGVHALAFRFNMVQATPSMVPRRLDGDDQSGRTESTHSSASRGWRDCKIST
jgi:hypothetical protein